MTAELRVVLAEQAIHLAVSVALTAGVYLALRPELRRELERAARVELARLSGADRRAWLASPAAEFARRRRAELVAQEWAPETARAHAVAGAPA